MLWISFLYVLWGINISYNIFVCTKGLIFSQRTIYLSGIIANQMKVFHRVVCSLPRYLNFCKFTCPIESIQYLLFSCRLFTWTFKFLLGEIYHSLINLPDQKNIFFVDWNTCIKSHNLHVIQYLFNINDYFHL